LNYKRLNILTPSLKLNAEYAISLKKNLNKLQAIHATSQMLSALEVWSGYLQLGLHFDNKPNQWFSQLQHYEENDTSHLYVCFFNVKLDSWRV
jgi:hypothetical protein